MFSCYHFETFTGFGILTELLWNYCGNFVPDTPEFFVDNCLATAQSIGDKADILLLEIEHFKYFCLSIRKNNRREQTVYICPRSVTEPSIDSSYCCKHNSPGNLLVVLLNLFMQKALKLL